MKFIKSDVFRRRGFAKQNRGVTTLSGPGTIVFNIYFMKSIKVNVFRRGGFAKQNRGVTLGNKVTDTPAHHYCIQYIS